MYSRYVTVIATTFVATHAVLAQQVGEIMPPAQAFQTKIEQGIPILFTPRAWKGVMISMPADAKHRLIDPLALLRAVYAADEIPGYYATPGYHNGIHTSVVLLPNAQRARVVRAYRSIERLPHRPKGSDEKRIIEITIRVYPTADTARQEAQHNHPTSPQGREEYYTFGNGLSSGRSFGVPFWTRRWIESQYEITAVVGRAVVSVWLLERGGRANAELAEALTWGLIARLGLEPDLQHPENKLVLNRVPVAPLSTLQQTGCQLHTDHPSQTIEHAILVYEPSFCEQWLRHRAYTGWRVRVQWGQRWVELEAFSWQMKTWDGRQVQLSRPAFPYRGDLVAPLQEVKQALGME